MVRVGILSDTHLPDNREARSLLQAIAGGSFAGVQLILHAGDIVVPGVLTALAPCPVFAVRGNMDPPSPELSHKRVVHVAGLRIGLIHGWGPPAGLPERVLGEFADLSLDCLVFGHSHMPVCRRENGLLLFNPGSATDRRGVPNASVGLLEIDNDTIQGRIIPLPTD